MKRFFKVLSIVITLTIVFTGLISCYTVSAAIGIEGPSQNFNWFDWSIEALKEVGLIFNPDRLHPTPLQMAEEINSKDPNANVEATDDSINNYINNNTTYNNQNNSKTYNTNTKNVLKYLSNYYMNNSGYDYYYTVDMDLFANKFDSAEYFNICKNIVRANQDRYYIGIYSDMDSGYVGTEFEVSTKRAYCLTCIPKEYGRIAQGTYTSGSQRGITLKVVHNSTWENVTVNTSGVVCYIYNKNTKEFVSNTKKSLLSGSDIWGRLPNTKNNVTSPQYDCFLITSGRNEYVKVWKTLEDYKSSTVGQQPYYINNTVYNSWNNSSGDYTVTTDNSNNATYQNCVDFENSFNNENGYYPSPQDINIYIESVPVPTPEPTPTPTPTPDNPSGGGSGSGSSVSGNSGGNASATATAQGGQGGQGGQASANNEGINITINNNHNINLGGGSGLSGNTVSGNGSGSSGGIGGIFDFLSQIGDFLGSLIKNIGNVLADIVTGIGSVIGSLLQGIPTVFNDFIGGVLGWLPPELRALVTLSISAMIIVGLIKLFRG